MTGIRCTHFTITVKLHDTGFIHRGNDVLPFVQAPEILSNEAAVSTRSSNGPFGLVRIPTVA